MKGDVEVSKNRGSWLLIMRILELLGYITGTPVSGNFTCGKGLMSWLSRCPQGYRAGFRAGLQHAKQVAPSHIAEA